MVGHWHTAHWLTWCTTYVRACHWVISHWPSTSSQRTFTMSRCRAAFRPCPANCCLTWWSAFVPRARLRMATWVTFHSGTHTHARTHTHGPFSGTTRVSRYQKGKNQSGFTEARDGEWQWHQLGHMQVCTSLQADNHNHASTPPLIFYRPDALPAAQQTASKHWRHSGTAVKNSIY